MHGGENPKRPFRVGVTADLRAPDGSVAFGQQYLDALGGDIVHSFLAADRRVVEAEDLSALQGLVHFSGNRVTAGSLETSDELLLIARLGVGCDQIDLEACTERGVLVSITPDAVRRPMAQGAFALLLGLSHKVAEKERAARAGNWERRASIVGKGLDGRVLGIIGLGNIGQELARLSMSFGMTVIAYGPRPIAAATVVEGVTPVALDQLLRTSDYVCVCCPLNAATRGMLSRERLGLLRPDAYLINVARGEIVDEAALVELLSSHSIAGAALDVFANEPLRTGNPLLGLDNVIVTPHAVGYTRRCSTK